MGDCFMEVLLWIGASPADQGHDGSSTLHLAVHATRVHCSACASPCYPCRGGVAISAYLHYHMAYAIVRGSTCMTCARVSGTTLGECLFGRGTVVDNILDT